MMVPFIDGIRSVQTPQLPNKIVIQSEDVRNISERFWEPSKINGGEDADILYLRNKPTKPKLDI